MSVPFEDDDAEATQFASDLDSTLAGEADATLPATEQAKAQKLSFFEAGQARYSKLKTVGEGAMGRVLLAKDHYLKRQVALKEIHGSISSKRQILKRFLNEAQITAQLDHPSIIPVYNLEVTDEGGIAYSMKLVEGKTLKELILDAKKAYKSGNATEGQLIQDRLLHHFLKVCDAMAFAHSRHIIHRDLKPANIMVGPFNEVYVMDWGIARLIEGEEEILDPKLAELIQPDKNEPEAERTQIGQILGTPRYMSPQQAAGKNNELDGATDQFSLGVILFELLTLKPAFSADNPVALLKSVLKVEKAAPTHAFTQSPVSKELQAIIDKATAKKAPQRYADVSAFAEDIRRHMRGEQVSAYPDNLLRQILRWMNRHPQTSLMIAFALLLISALVIMYSLYSRREALLETQRHETQLAQFLQAATQKSQGINSRFLKYETRLSAFASMAIEALTHGHNSTEKGYFLADFDQQKVPGLFYSPRYKKRISYEHPVIKLAPSTTLDVQSDIQKLNALTPEIQALWRQTSGQTGPELKALDTPLVWGYIGLESGAMWSYPGKGGYPADYDPRKRSWYTYARQEVGASWGVPYADIQGQGILLPCVQPLYNYQNQILGVAGIELKLSDIKRQFLPMTHPAHPEAWLVDAQGRSLGEDTLELPQEIRQKIQAKASGYLETKKALYAFYRLDIRGWYYIVKANAKEVFQK